MYAGATYIYRCFKLSKIANHIAPCNIDIWKQVVYITSKFQSVLQDLPACQSSKRSPLRSTKCQVENHCIENEYDQLSAILCCTMIKI